MENKNNDWLAVNLNMPEASHTDLIDNGIDTTNTTLKGRDFYKDTQVVKEMFTKPNTGEFDNEAYNKYYDTLAYGYNKFSDKEFTEKAMNDVAYHPFNDYKQADAKVDTEMYKVTRIANPYRLTMGIGGVNKFSDPKFSARELAQMNNVYDSASGKKLDWTPNDSNKSGLFDFLGTPTLVLAQYDEDGEHYDPERGTTVKHKKGEEKQDAKGFYYETLGTREAYNRKVLNWADTLTEEGTWIDNYNFMESDGLDKSIAGVVAKTVTKIAPMLIPGFGEYYGLALAGTELMNVIPMIAKAGMGLFVGDSHKDKPYWQKLNQVQGVYRKMNSNGVSDMASQNMVSAENFGQLVTDIVGQLKSQRGIASIPSMIGSKRNNIEGLKEVYAFYGKTLGDKMARGSLNAMEKAQIIERVPQAASYIERIVKNTEISKALSTAYMAATSAVGATEASKQLGLNERDTASLYLGTLMGYFVMMRSIPIGEWAIKGVGLDDAGKIASGVIRDRAKELAEQSGRLVTVAGEVLTDVAENSVKATGLTKLAQNAKGFNSFLVSKGKEWGKEIFQRLKDGEGYSGAVLSEAAEEMSEELMEDSIKGVYNGFSAMGYTSTDDKQFTYGSIKDIAARYAMAGFGGGLGGAIFHFSDPMRSASNADKKVQRQEETIVRNHGIEQLLSEVTKWEDKGIASKTLSFETEDITLGNEQSKTVFKPAATYKESQNAVMSDILRQRYRNMQDQIFQEGVISNIQLSKVYDDRAEALIKISANSPLLDDYDDLTNRILTLRNEIAQISTTTPEDAKSADVSNVATKAEAVKEKSIQLAKARLELKEIHSGEKFAEYQRFALFAINSSTASFQNGNVVPGTSLSEPFAQLSLNAYAVNSTNKPFFELNEIEQKTVREQHATFLELSAKDKLREGFKRFTFVNEKASLDVAALSELERSLRDRIIYLGKTDEGRSLAGSTLITPTRENVSSFNEVKENLTSNYYKDPIINSILNPNDPAYTLSNRVFGLTNVGLLLDSVEKLPLDVAKDLQRLTEFKISELVGDVDGTGEDLATYEVVNEELGIQGHVQFSLPALNALYDDKAAEVVAQELSGTKLQNIQSVFEKYEKLIENSTADDKIKKESLTALKDMFAHLNTLTPAEGVTIEELAKIQAALLAKIEAKSLNLLEEILRKFEIKVNGKKSSIIDLLSDEFMSIAKLNEITEYAINDLNVIENLNYMLNVMAELKSIVMAATEYSEVNGTTYGYNSTLNKTFPDVQLGIIGQDQSESIIQELRVIESRIKFLIELSKINAEDKIKNQKESGFIMESLFYEQLQQGKGLRTYLEDTKVFGESFLDDVTASAIEQANLINDTLVAHRAGSSSVPHTVEEIQAFEEQVVKIQLALHKRYEYFLGKSAESSTEDKIIDVFTQLYGMQGGEMSARAKVIFPPLEMTYGIPTTFSSSETKIQPLALYTWLNTSLAINTIDFSQQLLGTPNEEGKLSGIDSSTFAPFYGQETADKIAYAYSSNPVFMKQAAAALHSKDGFLPKIIKPFVHGVMIDGGPGVGKSTAIVKPLARMLREAGVPYWSAAPFTRQAQTLDNTFGKTSQKVLNKNELLLAILNNDAVLLAAVQNTNNWELVKDIYKSTNEKGEVIESISNYYMLKQSVIDDIKKKSPDVIEGLPPAIFIDEITHFSSAELTAIDAVLSGLKRPPILYMMGDTKQNGFLYKGDKHNVNLFNILGTPKLSNSVRNSNNHKKKNLDNITLFYNLVNEKYRYANLYGGNATYYTKTLQDIADFSRDPKKSLKLVNHTTATGKVYGEKIVKPGELTVGLVKQLVSNLSDGRTLGFITDNMNSDIVKAIQADPELSPLVSILDAVDILKVNIQKEDTVQGLEYEDIVVDVDWSKYYGPDQNVANHGAQTFMSNLYTLAFRSESGTIIVDNWFSNYNVIRIDTENSDSYVDTTLDENLVKAFKEDRSTVLKNIVEKFQDPEKVTTPFSTAGKVISTPKVIPDVLTEDELDIGEMALQSDLLSRSSLRTVTTENMSDSNLIAYPYYERSGIDSNEDLQYFRSKGDSAADARIKLKNIKIALLYKKGTQRSSLLSSIVGPKADVANIRIFVRGSKFNADTDSSKIGFTTKGKKLQNNETFLRIVLEIPRRGDDSLFFTIAALGLGDTVMSAKKPALEQKIRRLEREVMNSIPDGDFATVKDYEITDQNYLDNLAPFTNMQLERTKEAITFDEFKQDYEGVAVISNPYIITGKVPAAITDPRIAKAYENWIKGVKDEKKMAVSLAGRACCYISLDDSISPENLRREFEKERGEFLKDPSKAGVPRVKMVMLDQKAYEPMEWFKMTREAMNDHRKKTKKSIVSGMSTMASPVIAARILNTFIKVWSDTKDSKAILDVASYRIIDLTLRRLSTIFNLKEDSDPNYKKLVGIFSSLKSIKKYLGSKEIVNHFYTKEEAPAWGSTDHSDAIYVAFENNQLYKLMVAIEIAMFGGTVKVDGKEVDFGPAIDGINIGGDADFLDHIEAKFNSYFTSEPEFKQGIFTHAVYNQGYSEQKADSRSMQAAELALNMNFMVKAKLSLPNILINLDKVKSPEEAVLQKETELEEAKETFVNRVNELLTKLETVPGSVIVQEELAQTLSEGFAEETTVEDINNALENVEETVSTHLRESSEVLPVFKNLHLNSDPIAIINENLNLITDKFSRTDFSNVSVLLSTQLSNSILVSLSVEYDDETRVIHADIKANGEIVITQERAIKNKPESEEEYSKIYGSLTKTLMNSKEKYAYANDPFLVDTVVLALNSGDLNKIRGIIQKNPRVLTTFIAANEEQVVKDFLSILEEKDQNCLF